MNSLKLITRLLTCLLVLHFISCDSQHVIVKRRARVNVQAPEWWNEWWGKYIRDAIDPTVRPLLPASNSLDYDVQRPETDEEFRQLQGPSTRRPNQPSSRPFPQIIEQGPGQSVDNRFREPSTPSTARPPPPAPRRPAPSRQPGPVAFPRPDLTTVNPISSFQEQETPSPIPLSPRPQPSPPRTRPFPTPGRPSGNLRPQPQPQPQPQPKPQPRPQFPQSQFSQQQQPQVPTLRPVDQNELRPFQPVSPTLPPPSSTFIRPSDNRQRPTPSRPTLPGRPDSQVDSSGIKGGPKPRPTPSRFSRPVFTPRPTLAPNQPSAQTSGPFRPQPNVSSLAPASPSPRQPTPLRPLPVPGFEARPPSARLPIPAQPSPALTDIEPEVDSEEPELEPINPTPSPNTRPFPAPRPIPQLPGSQPRPVPSVRPVPQQPRPTAPPPVKGRPTFDNNRNNVPQPIFRPTVRPTLTETTTTPTQTFRPRPEVTFAPRPTVTFAPRPVNTFAPRPAITFAPRPEVTFAPRPAVTFAPRPAVTFAPRPVTQTFAPQPQIVEDTTKAPIQPRPRPQVPEFRPSPAPGSFRQPTERPAAKGGRRPQQPLGPSFNPRPIQTTPAPFREVQTLRPFPTPARPVDDIFDTEEPEEVNAQETPATSPPTPVRPTLPPRRPQSTLAPRPSFPQRPSPRPVSTPKIEENEDNEDQQTDQEQQVTTARPVAIPSRPSIPSKPTSSPARPFFQPTFRPTTTFETTTLSPTESEQNQEQPEEPQSSFGQRIPRPRPSFTPTTTTPAPTRQPAGVKLPTRGPRPQPGSQIREQIPFRPRPVQTTTQPSIPLAQQEDDTEPEEETRGPIQPQQPQTQSPFRPQPTQGPVTSRPVRPIEIITTQRPPVKTPTRPTAGQTARPFVPGTFRPRPNFGTTLAPTTTLSSLTSTEQTFDEDYEDTQAPNEPSQRPPQEIITTRPRPQPTGFTSPPRTSRPPQTLQQPTTTQRPALVPLVPIRITTDRPQQPIAPVDQSNDYDDGSNAQDITVPDFQPTRRPSSPSIPSSPDTQLVTRPETPSPAAQRPQLPQPSRPQIPTPSRPQQPREESDVRPRPSLPALPGPRQPTRVPGGKRPSGKTPNTSAVVYNPPLGPAISIDRPDRPSPDGSMPECTLLGTNYCILTKDYPMDGINEVVNRSYSRIKLMYEELQTVGDPDLFKSHVGDSLAAKGQFACETESNTMKPGWAKDEITKEWMIIVNTDIFPQQVRTESCKRPNEPCSFVAPYYESTCQQRYSLHRLIAVDPHDPGKSPVVALFKFPAGCSCRVHPVRITQTGEKS